MNPLLSKALNYLIKWKMQHPLKMGVFFKVGLTKVKYEEANIKTMAVGPPKDGIITIYYSNTFIEECLENLGNNEEHTAEFLAIIILHEILHILKGHLSIKTKDIQNIYSDVSHELVNIAEDLEVNQILVHDIFKVIRPISKPVEDLFLYNSILPTRIPLEVDVEDPIGQVFSWLKKIRDRYPNWKKKVCIGFGEEGDLNAIGSNENLGTADLEDVMLAVEETIDHPKPVKENNSKSYGNAENVNMDMDTKQEKVVFKSIAHLVDYYYYLIRKYGEKYAFNRIHKLNLTGVLPNKVKLPTLVRKPTIKSLFFVDVSGSMSFHKLRYVYPIIQPLVEKLGEVHYAAVDTQIVKTGTIYGPEFVKELYGGGGTMFRAPVYELVSRGYTHFVFYTDGQFTKFNLPDSILADEQVWFLVDYYGTLDEFHMPGIVVKLEDLMV